MKLKAPRLLIKQMILLGLITLMLGCTSANPPLMPSETKPQDTETPPDLKPNKPTIQPSPTVIPPAAEPSATETPVVLNYPTATPVQLINPGFEDQDANGMPTGWNVSGDAQAIVIEDRGHSSDWRLSHKASQAYQVETSQTVSGLADGWYTLRAWVQSSGGQNEVFLSLACGDEVKRVFVPPTTPGYRWLQLVVSNEVSDGPCTIALHSDGGPDTWASFDDIELVPGRAVLSVLGADISSLMKSEDMGGVYRYADGTQADALQILKDNGLNYARLRIWVDPADGYHGKQEILEMATRFKDMGLKILVDFHYSDNWADPGKQNKPAAWKDYDFEQLKKAVYDHTFDVCQSLAAQGTPPDMIQVGNEINSGMLWPDGDYQHMDNLAALLKEGYRAVKDCSSSTQVMLHIAEGGDNELARWWFGNMVSRDVPFDVIGISYYPYWHGSLGQLQYNLNDISARYDKDVIVVETAYAFTDQPGDSLDNIASTDIAIPNYPYTPAGQRAMLRDIMAVVRAVADGRGLGVFWWDAVWTAVPGNGWESTDPQSGNAWENQALFDYDDRALPALDEFLNP